MADFRVRSNSLLTPLETIGTLKKKRISDVLQKDLSVLNEADEGQEKSESSSSSSFDTGV